MPCAFGVDEVPPGVRYPQVKQAVHRLGQRSRVHPERLPCLDDARWFITRTELADVSEYDRSLWEERWSQALREHGGRVAQRPPNAHLTAEVNDLRPGRALDAGCGHGSDTLWLAAGGWQVTAVDFARDGPGIRPVDGRGDGGRTSPSASSGSRPILPPGRLTGTNTTLWSACTSTWPVRSRRWCSGWRQGSPEAGLCSAIDRLSSHSAPPGLKTGPLKIQYRDRPLPDCRWIAPRSGLRALSRGSVLLRQAEPAPPQQQRTNARAKSGCASRDRLCG